MEEHTVYNRMTGWQLEINKKVYEKYPKTKKEFSCWQERLRLTELRERSRERLVSEWKEQNKESV